MSAIYILIPITLLILVIAIAVFIWAVNSGQFNDLDAKSKSILMEPKENEEKSSHSTNLKD